MRRATGSRDAACASSHLERTCSSVLVLELMGAGPFCRHHSILYNPAESNGAGSRGGRAMPSRLGAPETLVRVALFITCLTDFYFPRVGIAVVKVLEHLGHTVEFPQGQTCCGQPMFNNGFARDARVLALRWVEAFEPYEAIVTPSGSCAAMV